MQRIWQIAGISLSFAGALCANGITGCTLNSQSLTLNQCYNANTFFTGPLTVDWGTAFGRANLTGSNPHDTTTGPWTTNIAGINIGVTIGSDYVGTAPPQLARINNEVYVWDPNQNKWVLPSLSNDPNIHTDLTYDGHFNAPGPSPTPGDGDHLLEMFHTGTGSYIITFDQGVHSAGLLISTQGSGTNHNFDGVISAYDRNSNLLGTYIINTVGVGAECLSLNNNPPTPCNDAPFIGIRAPGLLTDPQIYKLVISASTGGAPDSVLLDSLQFDTVPEPAALFLSGAGLVLLGVLRRKRTGNRNPQV